MRYRSLAAVIAAGILAATPLVYQGASAAPEPTPAVAAAHPQPSATPGGPAFKMAMPLSRPVFKTSQTEAGCAAIVASVRADIAKGVKTGHPTSCAFASLDTSGASGINATPMTPTCASGIVPGQWVATDRRTACGKETIEWTITSVPDNVIRGKGYLNGNITMESTTAYAQWITESSWLLDTGRTYGRAIPSGIAGKVVGCNPTGIFTCYAGTNWTTTVPGKAWNGNGNYQVTGSGTGLAGRTMLSTGQGWSLTISGPQTPTLSIVSSMPTNRCDGIITSPATTGCVFQVPGVLAFPQLGGNVPLPTFTWEIYQAQLSGLPGRLNTAFPLTRTMDGAVRTANNLVACPPAGRLDAATFRPTPAGYECDEYPFASTWEGASSTTTPGGPRNPVRAQCQMNKIPAGSGAFGFSRCYIPANENSSSGGLTGSFYNSNRMLDRDPFFIGYLP